MSDEAVAVEEPPVSPEQCAEAQAKLQHYAQTYGQHVMHMEPEVAEGVARSYRLLAVKGNLDPRHQCDASCAGVQYQTIAQLQRVIVRYASQAKT